MKNVGNDLVLHPFISIEEGLSNFGELEEFEVNSLQDMATFINNGPVSRVTAAKEINARSSRSHAILSIILEPKAKTESRWIEYILTEYIPD